LPSLHASRTATSEVDGRARPWAARHSALQAAADSDTSSHSAAGAAGGGGSGLTLDTGPGVVGQRHLALRHSSSLNEIGGAAEGGLAEGAWASSKPSPLRANERRRATLVGRSAYFSLRSRPLPFRSLFAAHRTSIAAAVNQARTSPVRLVRGEGHGVSD
jgi:hypothetical protein